MSDFEKPCLCGHVRDEHGGDAWYPNSTACTVEGCTCVAFERDDDAGMDTRSQTEGGL